VVVVGLQDRCQRTRHERKQQNSYKHQKDDEDALTGMSRVNVAVTDSCTSLNCEVQRYKVVL
jgi:hypothetical protein